MMLKFLTFCRLLFAPCLISVLIAITGPGVASADDSRSLIRAYAETIYVPAYSHVFISQNMRQPLASTLVVHNVDPKRAISLISVRYHNQAGALLREFLDEPRELQSFASSNFLTVINDDAGGVGANYIVEWEAKEAAISPTVEAIMIGGSGTHGISFSSVGRVIDRR